MSATARKSAPMPQDIMARKGGTPLVSLTAYTTPMAEMMDGICDFVLVGDSVGMVLHGLPSTVGVTMEMMIMHGQAVRRGLTTSMLVIDMPFGSYEESREQAFRNAARLMAETGAGAVKLEGGRGIEKTIQFLVSHGIPVMAHIGLTPQSVNTLGGYKVQGRGKEAKALMKDAKAVADAGAFAVVLEKVPAVMADKITAQIAIPTIGIGASANCDGQILVVDDMLGLFTAFKAKFVKRFAMLGDDAREAIQAYADEVQARSFPAPEHTFAEDVPEKTK
ncbi:ketopantoate hydroxymethyltransferase [Litoreibacter meonggei]|uniref:3-methyl-2-oxobutanoate hydroxymethyltransferase n=1 Tax=Litoreibacter meonggei TaxID=1049199 RepID=A0A497WL11_9RHOB|nr:3-methyl-2-oxobutanoate hydroxymethyltransferase [Litoreibacter meonggei]RLJ51775.1 ketopantoate hydroxymethyltransferase [Litoreibacter meonggei]